MRRRPRLHLLLLAAGLAAGDLVVVQAIESAGLTFDTLEGAGWSVHDASARLDWLDQQHARLQLDAAVAVLPEPLGTLTAVSITCPLAEIDADAGIQPTPHRQKRHRPGHVKVAQRVARPVRIAPNPVDLAAEDGRQHAVGPEHLGIEHRAS